MFGLWILAVLVSVILDLIICCVSDLNDFLLSVDVVDGAGSLHSLDRSKKSKNFPSV